MRLTHATVQVARTLLASPEPHQWLHDIARRSGSKTGVVHPILQRMLDAGWLADRREAQRHYYRVTDTGRRELAALLDRARGDARFTGEGAGQGDEG